jgi:hypothetical protein
MLQGLSTAPPAPSNQPPSLLASSATKHSAVPLGTPATDIARDSFAPPPVALQMQFSPFSASSSADASTSSLALPSPGTDYQHQLTQANSNPQPWPVYPLRFSHDSPFAPAPQLNLPLTQVQDSSASDLPAGDAGAGGVAAGATPSSAASGGAIVDVNSYLAQAAAAAFLPNLPPPVSAFHPAPSPELPTSCTAPAPNFSVGSAATGSVTASVLSSGAAADVALHLPNLPPLPLAMPGPVPSLALPTSGGALPQHTPTHLLPSATSAPRALEQTHLRFRDTAAASSKHQTDTPAMTGSGSEQQAGTAMMMHTNPSPDQRALRPASFPDGASVLLPSSSPLENNSATGASTTSATTTPANPFALSSSGLAPSGFSSQQQQQQQQQQRQQQQQQQLQRQRQQTLPLQPPPPPLQFQWPATVTNQQPVLDATHFFASLSANPTAARHHPEAGQAKRPASGPANSAAPASTSTMFATSTSSMFQTPAASSQPNVLSPQNAFTNFGLSPVRLFSEGVNSDFTSVSSAQHSAAREQNLRFTPTPTPFTRLSETSMLEGSASFGNDGFAAPLQSSTSTSFWSALGSSNNSSSSEARAPLGLFGGSPSANWSSVRNTTSPTAPQASPPLFALSRSVRRIMQEAPSARGRGERPLDDEGHDAELTAPFALACAFDRALQQAALNATEFIPADGEPARSGVPEEIFEQAWEAAAQSLAPLISEASGSSQLEVENALREHQSDCSIALLSLLHQKGDAFQQRCMEMNAIELRRRRQERTLQRVVEEAARQNRIPPDLSTKRMLRLLRRHLPITEIMGHRYRTNEEGNEPGRSSRVSFANDRSPDRTRAAKSSRPRCSRAEAQGSEDEFSEEDDSELSDSDYADDDDGDYDDSDSSVASSSRDGSSRDSGAESSSSDDSDDGASRAKKRKRSGSNLMAIPPPKWVDGDAPDAGFFLETFTKIYQEFKAFTRIHRNTGLTFAQLIQPCLKPTVLMELEVRSIAKLSQSDLLNRIKTRLGFCDEDYYTRQLELLTLPSCDQNRAAQLYKSFRKLSSPMLRIINEAKDSGVKLRTTNLSRIFRNHIRGYPALERWFSSRRFKNFSEAMRHISTQIHDCVAKEMGAHHDSLIIRGQVAGARTDIRGGKSEPSQGGQNRNSAQDHRSMRGQKQNRQSKSPPEASRGRTPNQRNHSDNSAGGRYPQRTAKEEEVFQAAMAKEKALPRGMYFHPRGPFCKENPCKSKICQGCNYHADADGKGHVRPNCRCRDHPDFVASGYFHDRHPGKTGALSLSQGPGNSDSSRHRVPPPPAQIRSSQFTHNRREDKPSRESRSEE